MDRAFGSKTGSGPMRSEQQANIDRRERLRLLALETIDLAKDPYFMKNHLGSYECKLCLTLHNNEGSYLAHTQGKRHQTNLARRAAREMKDAPVSLQPAKVKKVVPVRTMKIGLPGYKVTKRRDPATARWTLTFELEYPKIEEGLQPRHRFMSSFEQRVEPRDKNFQYLLFAAPPYETVAFKIPNLKLEKCVFPSLFLSGPLLTPGRNPDSKTGFNIEWNWDRERLTYTFTASFSSERQGEGEAPPAPEHEMQMMMA